MITKDELAKLLNGREYPDDITGAEAERAKRANLLVIFGGSDDLVELRGAIYDEVSEPGTVFITRAGELLPFLDRDEADVLRKHFVYEEAMKIRENAIQVQCLWCKDPKISWTYTTTAPANRVATFDIMEDGDVFCRGLVIDLKGL